VRHPVTIDRPVVRKRKHVRFRLYTLPIVAVASTLLARLYMNGGKQLSDLTAANVYGRF
jgi:hypothetical protein